LGIVAGALSPEVEDWEVVIGNSGGARCGHPPEMELEMELGMELAMVLEMELEMVLEIELEMVLWCWRYCENIW
jgi:hypothetical protein